MKVPDTGIPPLYDEQKGLRELARQRLKRDPVTRAQVTIADGLAENMLRHFAAEDAELVGRALLVVAASVGVLAQEGFPPAVIVNVTGFAGARMIADGRAWSEAQGAPDG
jgi:hypothetical protein